MNEERIINIVRVKENEIRELKRLLKISQYNHNQTKKKFREMKSKYKNFIDLSFEEFCKQS